jgi:hypothetical protein
MNIDRFSDLPFSGTESAAYLAPIVDSLDDAIISKNLNGMIQSWNTGPNGSLATLPTKLSASPWVYLHVAEG